MKDVAITVGLFALSFLLAAALAAATWSVGTRAQPHKPPASVPTQKAEPATESDSKPKPFNLGRYRVENLA